MIPEFVGRLPDHLDARPLGEDDLVKICPSRRTRSCVSTKKFFSLEGAELDIPESVIRSVARKALERNTGARGIRAILEQTMLDIMYDMPSRRDVRE